jgi:hypothetical protein
MRIAVMKAFHFARDWPNYYRQVYGERTDHFLCCKGHPGCSIIENGPCVDDVDEAIANGAEDDPSFCNS